ncbi:restriction endonuclease [Thermodesulfobacteriota bacterium]
MLDIIYHYPPELLQLLIDTVPLLSRSKKDVLIFFRGAGVPHSLAEDLWRRVETDIKNINKYEIVRIILSRLNDRGESSLRERREVLKRVVEFEAFSTCWPDDQLKAKGLVAEIRHVVNVKDSFTRIKQEREYEIKRRQQEYLNKTKSKEEKAAELGKIKDDLFGLFGLPSSDNKKRGKILEGVLNRLFDAYNILIREAFEVVEEGHGIIAQIDGVIEINGYPYLVEMKWWEKPIGKAEVSPHLVNIFNRGHAGGIFISASGYTDPAIVVCRDALSQKMIILCELEEIVFLLEDKGDLESMLKEKLNVAVNDKNPLYKLTSKRT